METSLQIVFFLLNCICGVISGQNKHLMYLPALRPLVAGPSQSALSNDDSYCFHFTWLGPQYDHHSFQNFEGKNCSEVFTGKKKALCVDPMTITQSGGKPDINYILKEYPIEATCKLSEGQVCAKYTVYYNGLPSNVTRYCTRVDIESEGRMTSGCLTEVQGVYSYEVCACFSGKGESGICNGSSSSSISSLALILLLFLALTNIRFE